MPWNDNANPGPWGSPPSGDDGDPKDPPKRPTGGGGPRGPRGPGVPPELGASIDNVRRRLSGLFGGGGGVPPGVFAAIAAAVFALWAASGIYFVQPNEEAVVTTFGAYSRSEKPGPRYHLPTPIERVEKVQITALNRLDVGGTGVGEGDVPQESRARRSATKSRRCTGNRA